MARVNFTGLAGNISDINANFTQLYELREYVSTPGYTAATPKLTMDGSFNWTFTGNIAAVNGTFSGTLGVTGAATFGGAATFNSGPVRVAGAGSAAGAVSTSYMQVSQGGIFWVDSTRSANGRIVDLQWGAGVLQGRFVNDAGGTTADWLRVVGTSAGVTSTTLDGNVLAANDNSKTLGDGTHRWSVVYAGTGTINTSDAREKTVVQPLTAAEIAVAKDLAREVGSFSFLASIAEKGGMARRHIGMTVQRAIAIMAGHGLDPMHYAFICHDKWDGGDRYGFRTDELLMFIARGFEARLAMLEAAAG